MAKREQMIRRQDALIEIWCRRPAATYRDIAKEAGVAENTFESWRRTDPEFMERFHAACKERFDTMEAAAMEQLEKLVQKGDFKAVKYVLDGLGYNPTTKVKADVGGDLDITIGVEE